MDKDDQAVFKESPPSVQAEQQFENDSYFLCAGIARISLRSLRLATPASRDAQDTLLAVLVNVSQHTATKRLRDSSAYEQARPLRFAE